jgi:hypothetical protein
MRKLLLLCLALAPGIASASDYSPAFTVAGSIQGTTYTGLELDISVHKRYMAVNGSLQAPNGLASPLSGTCQFTGAGGAWCILQMAHLSFILDLGQNLNGVLRALDASGNTISTLAVTYTGME